ncbi:hypothetical protein M9H77_33308 [Catharanthus roseus]|uniref:Uncharacterized protein n=1 Tax=Catharanthus roseus TaxID=4058 RepID=A0ACB9ZJS4_CATRO|nr:hypothetical protein M9H77_33308 [Catharanthus roseus]
MRVCLLIVNNARQMRSIVSQMLKYFPNDYEEICTGGIFTTITAVFKEKHRIDHFLTNFHKVVGRKVGGRKYTSLLKMFKEKDNLKVTYVDSIEEIQDAENVSISSYIVNVPRIEIINNCLLEIAVAMERSSSSAIGTGSFAKKGGESMNQSGLTGENVARGSQQSFLRFTENPFSGVGSSSSSSVAANLQVPVMQQQTPPPYIPPPYIPVMQQQQQTPPPYIPPPYIPVMQQQQTPPPYIPVMQQQQTPPPYIPPPYIPVMQQQQTPPPYIPVMQQQQQQNSSFRVYGDEMRSMLFSSTEEHGSSSSLPPQNLNSFIGLRFRADWTLEFGQSQQANLVFHPSGNPVFTPNVLHEILHQNEKGSNPTRNLDPREIITIQDEESSEPTKNLDFAPNYPQEIIALPDEEDPDFAMNDLSEILHQNEDSELTGIPDFAMNDLSEILHQTEDSELTGIPDFAPNEIHHHHHQNKEGSESEPTMTANAENFSPDKEGKGRADDKIDNQNLKISEELDSIFDGWNKEEDQELMALLRAPMEEDEIMKTLKENLNNNNNRSPPIPLPVPMEEQEYWNVGQNGGVLQSPMDSSSSFPLMETFENGNDFVEFENFLRDEEEEEEQSMNEDASAASLNQTGNNNNTGEGLGFWTQLYQNGDISQFY